MLKDIISTITNPLSSGRNGSKSPLTLQFPSIKESKEQKKDIGLKAIPAKRRKLPRRTFSISESITRTTRPKKSNSLPGNTEPTRTLSRFTRSSTSLNQTKCDPINILVVGARNVGKSALTVRFITKRYIGEYMSGETQRYDYHTFEKQQHQAVAFLDESNELTGKTYLESQLSEENLAWADGIILVYDVGNVSTFDYAKEAISYLSKKVPCQESQSKNFLVNCKPLLLIGNKTDLVKRRSVSDDAIRQAAENFPSWVACDELSAAEGFEYVHKCVSELISKVRERRRFLSGLSNKDNFKNIVGSVFRNKSLKMKSRNV